MRAAERTRVHKPLTVDQLRKFPGLETVSEEEANKIIESLNSLSVILFDYLKTIKLEGHDDK